MPDPLPPSLQTVRRLFWTFVGVLVLFLALSACLVVLALRCRQPDPATLTILGGPPGFVLLAIVIALSAYLRGVAASAEEKREKIIADDEHFYRANDDVRDAKLEALGRTCRNLQIAAPFMILLSLTVGLRLLAESVTKFGFDWPQRHKLGLLVADFVILEYLVVALIVLAVSHHYARNRDERIREQALQHHQNAAGGGAPST